MRHVSGFPGAGSIPGYIPDRCRNRNRNLGLGRSGVSITTTTTAALTTTTKIAGQADTYSGVILNQPVSGRGARFHPWLSHLTFKS